MKTLFRAECLLICAVLFVGPSTVSQASALPDGLYGWTADRDVNGNVDFLSIDTTTGQASFLFTVPIPSGYQALNLTYNPTDENFYGNLRSDSSALLAKITSSGAITTYAYTGESLVSPIEGIEYSKNEGGLIISGGDNLYRVTTGGVVSDAQFTYPPVYDQDVIVANAHGGELHVFDYNNAPQNGGFQILKYNDPPGPFGVSPTVTGVFSGTVTNSETDLAVDPFTNTFYAVNSSSLLRFDMTTQQEIAVGAYNYAGAIWGIAYVPEPSTVVLAMLGFGALVTVTFRRRGRFRKQTRQLVR